MAGYIRSVTVAHAYDDLHRLIDRLTPHQVSEVRTHVLRLVGRDDEETRHATTPSARPPAFAGVLDGPADLAESIDDFVGERFNHSS